MITVSEAHRIIEKAAQAHPCAVEKRPLFDSPGHVCAKDLKAPRDIQPFDNSAMDGYALRFQDIEGAFEAAPVSLRQTGVIAAGSGEAGKAVASGTCRKIMTGAPIPAGADTVIPVEMATDKGEDVIFSKPLPRGAHIRRAGEDFLKGSVVLPAGRLLTQAYIMPLAALGIPDVSVYGKPKVAALSTGEELVDDLSASLSFGQIYNSNKPYMQHFLPLLGAECCRAETLGDNVGGFCDVIGAILKEDNPDIIISSGAVSAGSFDFVKEGLQSMGAEILFHKMMLRPGKPNLFARLPNGALYFGLPGNPVATAVGMRFFVSRALRVMTGRDAEQPVFAQAMNTFKKKNKLKMFLKAAVFPDAAGALQATVLSGQESFMVHPFLTMNAWVELEEDCEEIRVGDRVKTYPVAPGAFSFEQV